MVRPEPIARVVRSGLEESIHLGHVAVCDAEGRLLASLGDPHRLVYSRSSMKPLQAAVSLRRISEPIADDLVAVMCASHNAEPEHVRGVRRLLRVGDLSESALRCPPAYPSEVRDLVRAGRPRRVFHNCSGKHAGMVLAAVRAGWGHEGYLAPSHPLQRDVLRAVRRGTGVDRPYIGIDGCGVPVHGVPLSAMATLFARLGRPDRWGPWGEHVEVATAAMRRHPYLVAGEGRSDTRVMQEVPGVIVKVGAEALHCGSVLEEGIGVAVKVADGGERAAAPALVHTLTSFGFIGPDQVERLAPILRRPVLGGGKRVGDVVIDFRLRRPRG